jgi:hypothetical protein
MNPVTEPTSFHTLGLEELALALGILNKADMGYALMRSVYENLTTEQIEERLTAAGHSLLARGDIAISDKGSPILEDGLENAIFPLIHFDKILQLSVVRGGDQFASSIHIQEGKKFTSHNVQADVVHVLEHGDVKDLPMYLVDAFSEIGKDETESGAVAARITPTMLASAAREKNIKKLEEVFVKENWHQKDAKELASDLIDQIVRVTLLFQLVNSTQSSPVQGEEGKMIWLLQGKNRSWLFEFPSIQDNAEGAAFHITSKEIIKHLTDFLNKRMPLKPQ